MGTGQLARMLALEAHCLGLDTVVVGPEEAPCAASVTAHRRVQFDDVDGVKAACRDADVVTYELEHLPVATLRALEGQRDAPNWLRPSASVLAVSQDRLHEKDMFKSLGISTAPYQAVDDHDGLGQAAATLGYPLLIKTRRDGFDGRGQRWVRGPQELAAVPAADLQGCIAEGAVSFDRELSVVAVRGLDGGIACYPLAENLHVENMLAVTRAPARRPTIAEAANAMAEKVAQHLDYVGTFCLELFQVGTTLLANEMAPRVHNSGHWTLDGAVTSQFENHLRAVAGLPLGSVNARGVSIMANLVGTLPPLSRLAALPSAKLHIYGKSPRPKRKIGHVTQVLPTHDDADRAEKALLDCVNGVG